MRNAVSSRSAASMLESLVTTSLNLPALRTARWTMRPKSSPATAPKSVGSLAVEVKDRKDQQQRENKTLSDVKGAHDSSSANEGKDSKDAVLEEFVEYTDILPNDEDEKRQSVLLKRQEHGLRVWEE